MSANQIAASYTVGHRLVKATFWFELKVFEKIIRAKKTLLPSFSACTDSLCTQSLHRCDGHRCRPVCRDELGDVNHQKLFKNPFIRRGLS
jgi:hypothetical protein